MEYLYGAMLLHSAGQKIEEASLSKVLKSANIDVDITKVRDVVSALEDYDIDKAVTAQKSSVVEAIPEDVEIEEEPKEAEDEEEMSAMRELFG